MKLADNFAYSGFCTFEDDGGRLYDQNFQLVIYVSGRTDRSGTVAGSCFYSGDSFKSSWKATTATAENPMTLEKAELLSVLGALQRANVQGITKLLIRTSSQERD